MDWDVMEREKRMQWSVLRKARSTFRTLGFTKAENEMTEAMDKVAASWDDLFERWEHNDANPITPIQGDVTQVFHVKQDGETDASDGKMAVSDGNDGVTEDEEVICDVPEDSKVMAWLIASTDSDVTGEFRPIDAWFRFTKSHHSIGYTRERFFRELKACAPGAWKKTNAGVVYKGLRLL